MTNEDTYAEERENLIEGDPIALVDELLELRRQLAGRGFEYSVQFTIKGRKIHPTHWMTREAAEEWLGTGEKSGFDGPYGPWSKALVKRAKSGPVLPIDN